MQANLEKAKHIRLLILDVDGILTNGHLFFGPDSKEETKAFHVRDGLGIQLLQTAGIPVAILTSRQNLALNERIETLNIQHYYANVKNKLSVYESLKTSLNLTDNAIACMGDDLPDYALLTRAGFSATVPEAPEIIRQQVDFITKCAGGNGAVREICEFILKAQEKYESVIKSYLV